MFGTPSRGPTESMGQFGAGREEYMPPLLFSLSPMPQEGGPGTPRSITRTGGGADSSMSTQRRSGATPQSVQTEATPPPPPPPVLRLTDDVVMEDPSTSARAGRHSLSPYGRPSPHAPSSKQPAPSYYGAPQQLMQFEPSPQYEDVWVTVFGFTQAEVPLILKEFSKCGDILQWGTYGQPQANFLHIQFQNKYAAQRALLRNGEHTTSSLIVGVKPLDPRHRGAIEGYDAVHGSPVQVLRPQAAPERPYRVEFGGGQAQQVPQPSRGVLSKVAQYVFGM